MESNNGLETNLISASMKHLIWKTTLWVHREKNGQKTCRRYRAIWRWSNRMNSLGTGIKQLTKIEELLNIQVQGQSCTNINLISYSKNRQKPLSLFYDWNWQPPVQFLELLKTVTSKSPQTIQSPASSKVRCFPNKF